jgi:iron complex outermembrane receptor protein
MVAKQHKGVAADLADAGLSFHFRRTTVAIAIAAVLTGATAVPVAAQESAEDAVVDEVVTYGKFRRSLIDALGTKRDSTSVVEAISAEDIGKLPDSSIAESLARLPGLAGERRNGRTSGISVRGFREDFIGSTLNGRELLGIGDNRGVEYDLYPAEIISGVVVYKTPNATQTTQGIGGVVDLRTVRPLDSESYFVVNANYEQNDLESGNPDFDDSGHRLAVSLAHNFMDDRLGVAFAAATTESPSQEQYFRGWGYPTADAHAPGNVILGGHDSYVRSGVLRCAVYRLSGREGVPRRRGGRCSVGCSRLCRHRHRQRPGDRWQFHRFPFRRTQRRRRLQRRTGDIRPECSFRRHR